MGITRSRRRFAALAIASVLVLAGAACGDETEPRSNDDVGSEEPEVTEVKHALPFPVIPFAAPHFVAIEKGFFEEVGLDVEVLPGDSGASSVAAVAAGSAEFGHVDLTALSLALNEDPSIGVVQIYQIYQRPLQAIFSLKSGENITTPEQITQGPIYTEPGSFNREIIQGWATNEGLGEIEYKDVSQEARDRLLVTGKIPAIASFLSTQGVLSGAAAEAGNELVTFELAQHGLDIVTSGVSVNRSFAEENPNTIKAYLSALNKAYVYTFENKEEAAEIMTELFPEFPPEAVIGSMEILEYSMTNDGAIPSSEFGSYDPQKVDETAGFINEAFGLDISADDLYTDEYVNEIDRD